MENILYIYKGSICNIRQQPKYNNCVLNSGPKYRVLFRKDVEQVWFILFFCRAIPEVVIPRQILTIFLQSWLVNLKYKVYFNTENCMLRPYNGN